MDYLDGRHRSKTAPYLEVSSDDEIILYRQGVTTKNARIQTSFTPDENDYPRRHVKSKNARVQTMLTAAEVDDQSNDFHRYSRNRDPPVSSDKLVDEQRDQIQAPPIRGQRVLVDEPDADPSKKATEDSPKDVSIVEMEPVNPIAGYAEEPLVSLVEACEPLTDLLHNVSFYVELALSETPDAPPDDLTIDESAAIRLYTIEWDHPHRSLYSMVNFHLKNLDREKLLPY
ncbi:unnamed protein product, partial [Adineta ricciae]